MGNFDAVVVERQIEHASLEEFISRGLELREKKDGINWELGDLADAVTNEFGSNYCYLHMRQSRCNSSSLSRPRHYRSR